VIVLALMALVLAGIIIGGVNLMDSAAKRGYW